MRATPRQSQWVSRLVVLATGMVLGLFVWKTYFAYVPHLYPVEFKQAQWLAASDEGPQGYFRKELYIPERIQQAWIIVAATDSFVLYVNGKAVDGKGYASLKVSGIYDVGPYLHAGKNVFGVVARRLSYPGPAMAVLEGAYVDHLGREHALATDVSWQFSPVEQRQGDGEILWYAEAFDASSWTMARARGRPQSSEIYPLSMHPWAFTMLPQGKWIGHSSAAQEQATVSSMLRLPSKVEDAWIRITAAKPYTLAINGVTVQGGDTPEDAETMKLLRFQSARVWKDEAFFSTDIYQIASLLRTGTNHITISSGQWFAPLPGLLVDGFVVSQGEGRPFGSDATWSAGPPSQMTQQQPPQHAPIIRVDGMGLRDAFPVKKVMAATLPLRYTIREMGKLSVVMLLTGGVVYLLWVGTSRILYALQGGDPAQAKSLDAVTHVPITLALGSLYLLSFDVRLDPAFPFQTRILWLAAISLLIFKLGLLLEAWLRKTRRPLARLDAPARSAPTAHYSAVLLLACLLIVGAWLRLHNLDAQSLYHDEIHMVNYVQGIFEKGYPYKMIGPIERPLATYELVPYPIALSAKFLGFNDFALRLPAALFGIMTIILIYVVGTQMVDQRVGVLAAAIYTFCPQALLWAKYLWHPQQTQFFALLTSSLFYQAIRSTPLSPGYLYLAALSFILTYLSWEGVGFLLPALALGLLVVRGRDFTWIYNKHLWMAASIVCVAVMLQLIRRVLLQVPYLVVGQGLSDVSLPTFYFLDPMYEPTFYLRNFLWLENNVILTLLLMSMLPFLYKQSGFSYYSALLLSILFMMTNLLSNSAIRYVYYLQPFLILSASSATFSILDRTLDALKNSFLWIATLLRGVVMSILLCLIAVASSPAAKLYRINNFPFPSGVQTRIDSYYIDYRTTAKYVESNYSDGDLVISIVARALEYYSDVRSDYFVETYTMRQVFYDPSELTPRYLEKVVGNPVIRDFNELHEILSRSKRVWFIAVPHSIFLRMSGPEIRQYVQKEGKIVYESYNAKIYLIQI